ncbi:MAG TPA: hypothetical protein VFI04_01655 [Gaiellaceae bacterium]|jgi:hypothetical protein|nr:hypothetical protein [Gaiellaceae bacterium]
MRLHSLRDRALYVTPIRLGLGLAWVAVARLAGAPAAGSLLAFAGGAFVTVFTLYNDPRARFLPRREPEPAPAGAPVAGRLRQAFAATLPSTAGVSVLAAISLGFQPTLAALLGGVSAGLGLAGGLYALRADPSLYVDPRSGVVYRR